MENRMDKKRNLLLENNIVAMFSIHAEWTNEDNPFIIDRSAYIVEADPYDSISSVFNQSTLDAILLSRFGYNNTTGSTKYTLKGFYIMESNIIPPALPDKLYIINPDKFSLRSVGERYIYVKTQPKILFEVKGSKNGKIYTPIK